MRPLFIALFVFLLFAGNSGLSQMGRFTMTLMSSWDNHYTNSFAKTWPLDPAEEESAKGSQGESETGEGDEYLSHKWSSIKLSGISNVVGHEADLLFENICRDIIVPPPRA